MFSVWKLLTQSTNFCPITSSVARNGQLITQSSHIIPLTLLGSGSTPVSLSVSRRSGSEGKSVYWILTIKQDRAKGPCRTECHFRNIYIFLLAYLYLLPYSVQIILVWNLLIILHYDMIVLTRSMLIVSYHLICCNLIFIIVAPHANHFNIRQGGQI